MDFKEILKTVAPGLATALIGPLGGLAVQAIGTALSIPDATQEKIQAAIQGATPDDMLKLKQAEQDFQAKMKELDIDLERIAAGDRDSARKREAAVGDKTTRNIAYLVVGAFVGVVVATLGGWSKVDSVLAGTLIGYLSAKCEQVVSYYFGSSAGSKHKTELMRK